jgi:alpha-1,4-digalacturonate transport system permease protein
MLIIATLDDPTNHYFGTSLFGNQLCLGLLNSPWGVMLPSCGHTNWQLCLCVNTCSRFPMNYWKQPGSNHATEWRIYWRIILPSQRPGLSCAGTFLGNVAMERLSLAIS